MHYEFYGELAQLGEHLPCTQGVKSSNLFISTTQIRKRICKKEPKKLNSKQYFQSRKKGRKVDALAHEDEEGRK